VLIFINNEKLKGFNFIKTISRKEGREDIVKVYNRELILSLVNKFSENPVFYDYCSHIVTKFDITEWQNLRWAAYEIELAYKDNYGKKPLMIIQDFSEQDLKNIEESKAYMRMALIGEMVSELGVIIDAWTEEEIPSDSFLEKFEYFFLRRELPIPYKK